MTVVSHEVPVLLETIEMLQEQVSSLKQQLGHEEDAAFAMRCRSKFGLSPSEAKFLSVLMNARIASKASLYEAHYHDDPDGPDLTIVGIWVHHLRKKLTPFGVTIETVWGQGFWLSPEMRQRVTHLLSGELQ